MKQLYRTIIIALFALPVFASDLIGVLNDDARTKADQARDLRDRPEVIISLLDISEGDQIADIFAGGGYYSQLLAAVVGRKGKVLLHNNAAYREFAAEGIEARFQKHKPGNLIMHDAEADDLKLGNGKLDAAMIVMSYHDLYFVDKENGWETIDSAAFLTQVFNALKPGGRFLIVDHTAAPGSGKSSAQTLHRIDPAFAEIDIEQYGFELVAESPVLRNPMDDYAMSVFEPSIRGKSDRFVHVYDKPIR